MIVVGVALPPLQEIVVGCQFSGWLSLGPFDAAGGDPPLERGGDGARDLVLHGEDVAHVAVVAIRPQMRLGRGVDQLHGDAEPSVRAAHAALDDVAHTQSSPHRGHVHGRAATAIRNT
jgi:hypothetical protein